jgi:arylsulfatase A-like enzyme
MLANNRRQPFFAFINYTEAHVPYAPREPYRSRFQEPGTDIDAAMALGRRSPAEHYLMEPFTQSEFQILSRLYDAEIAELSATVGSLLRTLLRYGRFDDTWIVITSDHGEYFGENGLFEHIFGLYNAAIDVPLIIRPPGGTGAPRIDDRAGQLVDLFPTLLATAGIDDLEIRHHGFDLLSQDPAPRRKSIFTECYFPVRFLRALEYRGLEAYKDRVRGHLRRLRALESDGFRLIWSSDGRHEFYDLTKDPGETVNLYESEELADLVDDYLQRLTAKVSEYGANSALPALLEGGITGPAAAPDVDAETRDALRELGYVR